MNVHGKGTANSHASAPGTTSEERDKATGRLVSKPFRIGRNYIKFLIGGGNAPDRLGMRLLIDGAAVRSATGHDATAMRQEIWDLREFDGRDAVLEISDQHNAGWGHIGVDRIVFTDDDGVARPVEDAPDFGTMALAVLGEADGRAVAVIAGAAGAESLFQSIAAAKDSNEVEKPLGVRISGGLAVPFRLEPGAERKITFVIAWHFPRVQYSAVRMPGWDTIQDLGKLKRYYAKRFADAPAVADHIARNFQRLSADTHLWRDTWYDSTLPHWLLDRTLLNISTLATATCHRFDNGRYWFWEGLYCCQGTCTHVWAHAQGIGRLFPEIERDLRERVDYGIGFVENTGAILQRAETEASALIAVDGHAGTILRTLREHQMSPDAAFLKRVWPKVKKAVEWLVTQDGDEDGVISGAQLHTLDQPWFGHISWISSLYAAALKAGAVMAREMNDDASAARWEKIAGMASQRISEDLWDKKQFFIQKAPPDKLNELGAGYGCHIDQVYGQSWAWQVGLPRVLPEDQTRKALESLWKYNFTPDVGPFREGSPIPGGRWYAMPGEGGLVMCTFPDPEHSRPAGDGFHAFYFNECMSGFEYQVAAHMIWEGGDLLEKGLAIARMIHDRYHATRRNPWNEVECGDHYGRALASYGVFTAVCGFESDGPKQHLGFAPRLTPEDFKAPFTSAEGWGTFSQKITGGTMEAKVAVKHGKVPLKTLALATTATMVTASLAGKPVPATVATTDGRAIVSLDVTIESGQELVLNLS